MNIRTFSDYYSGSGYTGLFSSSGTYDTGSGDYLPVNGGDSSFLQLNPGFSSDALGLNTSGVDQGLPAIGGSVQALTSGSGYYPQALPLTQAQSVATGFPVVNWDSALADASGINITPTSITQSGYPQALPLTAAQSAQTGLPVTNWNSSLANEFAASLTDPAAVSPEGTPGLSAVQGGSAGNTIAVRATNFGAPNDPDVYGILSNGKLADSLTAQGMGAFGPLGSGALALSPSAEALLGAQPGDVIQLTDANGNVSYGYFADRTSPTITDNVVDIWNPNGNNWVQPFNAISATNLGGGQAGLYGSSVARLGASNIASVQNTALGYGVFY